MWHGGAQPRLDLVALYPACFDWKAPRPLKIGIHQDLVNAGQVKRAVRNALRAYCSRRAYLKAMGAGVPRIDLEGQPVGEVSPDEALVAQAQLSAKQPESTPPPKQPTRHLPANTPLSEDNIVSGRLELTVKFSQLPQPITVKAGMKIGIQTDTALVVATLSPKVWKKLQQAHAIWPQWVASLTGKLGAQVPADTGIVVVLEQPALQVFEKKAKPSTQPTTAA